MDGKFDSREFLTELLKLNKTSTYQIQTVVAEVAICSHAHKVIADRLLWQNQVRYCDITLKLVQEIFVMGSFWTPSFFFFFSVPF